jgi:hypothetical protein
MSTDNIPTVNPAELPPGDRQRLARIAARLGSNDISTGTLASLRRADPTVVARQAAFHRLLAGEHEANLDHESIVRWATAVHLIAIAGRERATHDKGDGEVLASIGYPESRLARLLASRDEGYRDQAVLCARFLHAKNASVSMLDLAELALTEGRRETRAEQLRHRIARDYYRAADSGTN